MFTAGRILRNLNRGDPNAGPVSSVLIPQPKKTKDRRKFRCYVPFVWQALMATCIGFIVILIGITLCVVGYYADQIKSLTTPRRLDNITSALSLGREGKTSGDGAGTPGGRGGAGESAAAPGTAGYNYLRCMIYLGPALMSCGSFAIVFSCVVVCETRDKLLEFMDEREKSNLPRKSNLKFDFFKSIVVPSLPVDRRRKHVAVASSSAVDVVASERPKPIRPASLSVVELDVGRLLPGPAEDDRFSTSCRGEKERTGSDHGCDEERIGSGHGTEFSPYSAKQRPVLDCVCTNHRPELDRLFLTGCATETDGRFTTDVGYSTDYFSADPRSGLDNQNHRSTGSIEGKMEVTASDGNLSLITAPIDRSVGSLPLPNGFLVITSPLRSNDDRYRRSIDGSSSADYRTDLNRRSRSGSLDVSGRETARRICTTELNPRELAANNPIQSGPKSLLKTDEEAARTIAQRFTKGPRDGLFVHGSVERQDHGPARKPPTHICSSAEDNHPRYQFLEISTTASSVPQSRFSPGVASCRRPASGSLQSISGAIEQLRPQTLRGQQSVHIIHKAHVHQEPTPSKTFSTLPPRLSQQHQQQLEELQPEVGQEQRRSSVPLPLSLPHSTTTE